MDPRYITQRDLREVVEIEGIIFSNPWSIDDFRECLKDRHTLGMVSTLETGRVVGYMIYRVESGIIELLHLGVAPRYQRLGIGTLLLDKIKDRGKKIRLHVTDDNLQAHLFFKASRMRAVSVVRTAEGDVYRFAWNPSRIREYV